MHHRRTILKGVASLPFAAILADPLLAHAAAVNLEQVSLVTAEGRAVAASLALPEAAQAPAILLVHEWWGLNDQIKAVAAEFAREGFVALAVDLYDGGVATDGRCAGADAEGRCGRGDRYPDRVDRLAAPAKPGERQARHHRLVFRWRLVAQRLAGGAGR